MLKGKLMILEILSIIFVPGVMTLYIVLAIKKLAKKNHFKENLVAIDTQNCYTE